MTDVRKGSCLCGAVTFEIRAAFDRFYLCHCSRCRKSSGSAHASNLFAPDAELNWQSGEELLRTYQVPETRFSRQFCSQCGAQVPQMLSDGTTIKVPAGCLDGELGERPRAHIFTGSRADWDHELELVPAFEDRAR